MKMKVLEFTAKSFHELVVPRATKNLSRDESWISDVYLGESDESKTNFHKYFALFQDHNDCEFGQFDAELGSILEVIAVHYLPESNCGLVKSLRLENNEKQGEHRLNCGWVQRLIEEAKMSLNKVAELNGRQGVCEIFYHVGINFNSGTGYPLSYLYDIGFRLVETKQILNTSSQNNCIHLLLYKPSVIPDFQFGKGALPGQIDPYVIIKFLKELLTSTSYVESCLKASDIEELQVLIRNLGHKPVSKMFVRSSFPWHGSNGLSSNQVAVVGGGVAGLAAAASLSEAGFDVVLLEASDYLGGRVKQVKPFKGFAPIDLGGEFIHGSDSIINRIAKENGWLVQPCYRCDGTEKEDMFYYKGEFHPLLSDHPDIKDAWRAWDELILYWDKVAEEDIFQIPEYSDNKSGEDTIFPRNGGKLEANCFTQSACLSVDNLAATASEIGKAQEVEREERDGSENLRTQFMPHGDMTILEWLERRQCNEDLIAIFEAMYCQTVAATPSQMGVLESSREENAWEYGEGNYRLVDSYSKLVKYLLDKCKKVEKRLCWQVKEIDWKGVADGKLDKLNSGGNISLTNQHGEVLSAKYVVITVPLTILKDGDINFIPDLPANKRRAIDTIQMRGALKIVCRFKSQFWPEKLNLIYSVRGFVSQIWMYTRDSADSDEKCHVIAGFQTAEPAEEKIDLSGKEVLDGLLDQLDEMFSTDEDLHPATDSLLDYVYYHWSNHPFIRGGYSSPTALAQGMRHVLASPVGNCLFFAGEATSVTGCATVHTAMETGLRAAREVCSRDERVHTELGKTGPVIGKNQDVDHSVVAHSQ